MPPPELSSSLILFEGKPLTISAQFYQNSLPVEGTAYQIAEGFIIQIPDIAQKAGLHVEILRLNVAPNKHIDWLKKRSRFTDVLLANIRLVEIGLNLMMFPTVIFCELNVSFYALYQGIRRIWCPFAPLLIEIFFTAYKSTAKEMILDLIGGKIAHQSIAYRIENRRHIFGELSLLQAL